jgi:hypothetical protein
MKKSSRGSSLPFLMGWLNLCMGHGLTETLKTGLKAHHVESPPVTGTGDLPVSQVIHRLRMLLHGQHAHPVLNF